MTGEKNRTVTMGNLTEALLSLSKKLKEYLTEKYSGPLDYIQRLFGYENFNQDPKNVLGGYESVGEMANDIRRLREQYEELAKSPETESGQRLDELIAKLIEERVAGIGAAGHVRPAGEAKDYIRKEVRRCLEGDGSVLQEIEKRLELLREGTGDSWEELETKVVKRKKGSDAG